MLMEINFFLQLSTMQKKKTKYESIFTNDDDEK